MLFWQFIVCSMAYFGFSSIYFLLSVVNARICLDTTDPPPQRIVEVWFINKSHTAVQTAENDNCTHKILHKTLMCTPILNKVFSSLL